MYYTAVSGTVQSFNYGATESSYTNSIGATGSRQLVDQNYGVCIAVQSGYCSITWSQSAYNSFTVSNDTEAVSDLLGTNVGVYGNECVYDFVVIPAPYLSNGTLFYTDRFCGNYLPTVESNMVKLAHPSMLLFISNMFQLTQLRLC